MLCCHSISSFLLEEHNLAQIVSKSIPPPSPELEELLCVKQEAGSYKFLLNYKVLRLCGHRLSLGAESGFPPISISLQQHVVPLICMGTGVVQSVSIEKQRARAVAGEQSQEVSWEGMWQGRGGLASTLIECFLQSVALCLLLLIQTKAILKKFSEGSEVQT